MPIVRSESEIVVESSLGRDLMRRAHTALEMTGAALVVVVVLELLGRPTSTWRLELALTLGALWFTQFLLAFNYRGPDPLPARRLRIRDADVVLERYGALEGRVERPAVLRREGALLSRSRWVISDATGRTIELESAALGQPEMELLQALLTAPAA